MSTPAWKKRANQEAHRKEKKQKEHQKLLKPTKRSKNEPKRSETNAYRRETPEYPSYASNGAISVGKQEPKQYTGDYITGIAVMHKSNLVPVSVETNPIDFATMRRN